MTEGLLVLVQLVMAAITTAPWVISLDRPLFLTVAFLVSAAASRPKPRSVTGALSALCHVSFIAASGTRSCGRFGPASDGSTVDKSSETFFVKIGAGVASVRNQPCSLQYRSTSSTSSLVRPVARK